MKRLILLLSLLLVTSSAYANEVIKKTAIKSAGTVTVVRTDAGAAQLQYTLVTDNGVTVTAKSPTTNEEAISTFKDLSNAIKDHAWWLISAFAIFCLMFIMNTIGIFNKLGSGYAWLAMWGLSILAGLFFAFNNDGFHWNVFLRYMTAGPVIACIRDFVKDFIIPKFKKSPT
jgi:hypothetical protein